MEIDKNNNIIILDSKYGKGQGIKMINRKSSGFALIELILVATAIALVGFIGYFALNSSSAASVDNKVFLIGDSVLTYTNNSIDLRSEYKSRGWIATIDGVPGRDLIHGLSHIKNNASIIKEIKNSRAIIIELGLNDYDLSEANFVNRTDDLYKYIKQINPSIKIYWVNLAAFGQGNTSEYRAKRTAVINSKLEQYASNHRITIVNWKNLADPKTDFDNNGIHPNEQGKRKLANLLLRRLGQFDSNN